MNEAQRLFQEGMQVIRQEKDMVRGQKLLTESLTRDPNNDMAWVWLSQTLEDPQRKLKALNRALQINPNNALAQKLKAKATPNSQIVKTGTGSTLQAALANSKAAKPKETDPGALIGSSSVSMTAKAMYIGGILYSIVAVVFVIYLAFSQYNRQIIDDLMPGIGIAGLHVLLGVFSAYLLFTERQKQLDFYENAVVLKDGSNEKRWQWTDFDQVRLSDRIVRHNSSSVKWRQRIYQMHLFVRDKHVLTIDKRFQDFEQVGVLIRMKTYPHILEKHLKQLERGETLKYNRIHVTNEMIQKGGKKVSWSQVESWELKNDHLIIYQKDRRGKKSFHLDSVSNAHVLVALMDKAAPRR